MDEEGNKVGVAIGGAYNRQLNTEDAGGAVYGEIHGAKEIGGYQFFLDANGHWYNTAPRHNSNFYLNSFVGREFEDGSSGNIAVSYEQINTDLYIKRREEDILLYGGTTYDGIRVRNENRLYVNTAFTYPLEDDMGIDVDFSMSRLLIGQHETGEGLPPLPREPDPFMTERRDFAIGTVLGGYWTPKHARFNVRFQYSTNEQRNTVEPMREVSEQELKRRRETNARNDFLGEQVLLAGLAEYRLSRNDTLSMNGSVGIYRYDTPDTTNNFDRDEQTIHAQIRYGRAFSSVLSFSLTGQAYLTHLVYLFGENSNDNNWNRVFRLAPAVRYVVEDVIESHLEAAVLANYTEYDFEGRTRNIRGRSFRELTLRDSLVIALTDDVGISSVGEVRISERGSFSWGEFAESLLERTRTEVLESELFTAPSETFVCAVGGKLSRVKNFRTNPRNELLPFSDRTSLGPTFRFLMALSEVSSIDVTGWWEHRFEDSELVGRTPWLFLTVGLKL